MSTARTRRPALVAVVICALLVGCVHRREDRELRVMPTPEMVLGNSTVVARVRVVAKDPVDAPYKKWTLRCGHYYQVEVVDALKGEPGEKLDFVSNEELEPGGDYLVAVTDLSGRAPDRSERALAELGENPEARLQCRPRYARFASDAARIEPGEDGMVVVSRGAIMFPEQVRKQAIGGRVPWNVVKRDLFAAAPEETAAEAVAPQVTPAATPAVTPASPENPVAMPEPATAAPPEPPPAPPAPAKKPPEPPKKESSPWIWEWDW